jgi:hypothetical protein
MSDTMILPTANQIDSNDISLNSAQPTTTNNKNNLEFGNLSIKDVFIVAKDFMKGFN